MKAKQHANNVIEAYNKYLESKDSVPLTKAISQTLTDIAFNDLKQLREARNVNTDYGLFLIITLHRSRYTAGLLRTLSN